MGKRIIGFSADTHFSTSFPVSPQQAQEASPVQLAVSAIKNVRAPASADIPKSFSTDFTGAHDFFVGDDPVPRTEVIDFLNQAAISPEPTSLGGDETISPADAKTMSDALSGLHWEPIT